MTRPSLLLAAAAGFSLLSLGGASAQAMAAKPAGRADPATKPPCTDNSRACLEKIARLYIDALVTHDGAPIPLAPTVRRSENALTNARGPFEVRESFVRTHMVEGVRDVRLYADPEKGEVVAFFRADIDLKENNADATTRAGDTDYKVSVTVPSGAYTVHEAERFKIVDGYITEIEIVAHVEKGKGGGSGWPVERNAAVSAVSK